MTDKDLIDCLTLLDIADGLLVRRGHGVLAARLSGVTEEVRAIVRQPHRTLNS